MTRLIVRFGIPFGGVFLMYLMSKNIYYARFLGLPNSTVGVAIVIVLSFLPVTKSVFQLGIEDYKTAMLFELLSPVLVCMVLMFLTKYLTGTIFVAIMNSYFLGMSLSYTGRVISWRFK